MDYDLLIKNGQTVDGMPVEIAIKEEKIAAVAATISGSAKETIHLEPGTYVSAGWIMITFIVLKKWLFIMIIQMKLGSKRVLRQ